MGSWEREAQFIEDLERCVHHKASTGALARLAAAALEDEPQVRKHGDTVMQLLQGAAHLQMQSALLLLLLRAVLLEACTWAVFKRSLQAVRCPGRRIRP